jgi:hypothetical protein
MLPKGGGGIELQFGGNNSVYIPRDMYWEDNGEEREDHVCDTS